MGFLDSALDFVAAPFTGGLSLGGLGGIMSAGAQPAGTIAATPYSINTGLFGGGLQDGKVLGQIENSALERFQGQSMDRANMFGSWLASGGNSAISQGASHLMRASPGQLSTMGSRLYGAGMMDDPRRGLGAGALGLSQQYMDQLQGFDPYAQAEQQFNQLDAILEPGRAQARSGTAAGLLSTGRLGSTAGGRVQGELEGAIERERQALLTDQLGQAYGREAQLAGLAESAGGFGSGLLSGSLQDQLAAFGGAAGIQGQLVDQGATLQKLGLGTKQIYQDLSQKEMAGALGVQDSLLNTILAGSNITSPVGTTAAKPSYFDSFIGGVAPGVGQAAGGWLFGG